MIAPSSRPVAGSQCQSAAAVDAGEVDTAAAQSALDARISTLAVRAPKPDDEALEEQREAFDEIVRAAAETDREINALRDIAMEQMKQDDELLKKWIALI